MFNHIQGRLTEKLPTHAVVDCGGVGYHLNISLNTFSKLGDSENVKLLVHLAVKEDALTLYGFIDEDERRLFRQLISVSGIGENTARMMLSSLGPQEIQSAIVNGNIPLLQSIKGIGNKTAQRVILDLKDKLSKGEAITTLVAGDRISGANAQLRDQALAALLTLGFPKPAVEKTLNALLQGDKEDMSVERLIKHALKHL